MALPESRGYRVKKRLLGPPLHTERLAHERLGKPTALAVFASDNLSSSAYATEEILRVAVPAVGVAAFSLVVPITTALLIVLAFLILSYRQTIKAYPSAGGAYIVTRDNFGLLPAQVAGVALLTDYVLTVSVSVAAGIAAVASAVPALVPFQLWLSIACVVLIAAIDRKMIPLENTSRWPRLVSWRGMKLSPAWKLARRGKSAKLVFAASTRMSIVPICSR